MRIIESVKIPEHTKNVCVAIVCDACGKKGEQKNSYYETMLVPSDGNEMCERTETTVCITLENCCEIEGTEGGSRKSKYVHLCPACFHRIIVSSIEKNGLKMNITDVDW